MDTEIELKFLVSDDVTSSIPALVTQFTKTVTTKPARNLQNAYFDTPSRELRALDIGLRTRCCDGVCEQTIKLASQNIGSLHQREEYNLPIEGNRPNLHDFKPEIWPHGVSVAALQESIYPLFSTNFIRRTWLIETQSGSHIELVLDKGEVAANAKVESISEIEIELIKGEQADLFALAEKLITQLPLRFGLYSKAAKGYFLADDTPPMPQPEVGLVPVSAGDNQEQALEKCLAYGIEFLQHHEQCYFDNPTLKTLKRVTDAVSLIRHCLWLFGDIVDKQATTGLRKELKWVLSELSWVETAIQLKTFTSKKHAYYKKINGVPALSEIINTLKAEQPTEAQIKQFFTSSRYNLLLLDLTIWLAGKGWQQSWGHSQQQAAGRPVTEITQQLFNKDWQEMGQLLSGDTLNAQDYLNLKPKLERNLLSGSCLGALFDSHARQEFRTPWLDVIYGTFELFTLDYLYQLCQGQDDEQYNKIHRWLAQKNTSLLAAIEQSREATHTAQPYWR